jgi:hypothetical protein
VGVVGIFLPAGKSQRFIPIPLASPVTGYPNQQLYPQHPYNLQQPYDPQNPYNPQQSYNPQNPYNSQHYPPMGN